MTEDELRTIVGSEIRQALSYMGGKLSEERREALDYYLGEPLGNEIEGRSQVVSTDTQDVIESMMPTFTKIFMGSDKIVQCEPSGPEDEQAAEQATDYINYVITVDNDAYPVFADWIKDALLQKNGVVKVYWDDTPIMRRETLTGVNIADLQVLLEDDSVEVVEHSERAPTTEEAPFFPDGIVHDVTIKRKILNGRVKIVPIPPEEFLISRRAVTLKDAPFTCHRVKRTYSDLREMGYSKKKLEEIPGFAESDLNDERVNRYESEEEFPDGTDIRDPSMREVWLYECYIKTDFDGDGIAEMRQVTVAGPGYKVLENELIDDDHPFVSLTPVRMPHKFFGRSVADLVKDIQQIKTTLWRQLLDNVYNVNNARAVISDRLNLDDWLTLRPGGAVRCEGPVGDAYLPIQTQNIGNFIYPALEYTDGVREVRTGITRYNQGLDANSLNKTATGIQSILSQAQERLLLIAREFAEGGFKPLGKKVLRLIINHQDKPRTVRLRNEWVPIDPRSWNAEMDVSIAVGLGHGTRDQQMMMARMIMEIHAQIVQFQGGVSGPLVTAEHIYNAFQEVIKAAGFKATERFVGDPQNAPPQEPKPDPKMVEVQGKLEADKQRMQMEQQAKQEDAVLEREKMTAEIELEKVKAEAEIQLAWQKAEADMQIAKMKAEHELEIRERDAQVNAALRQQESVAKQAAMSNGEMQ